jgi:hypothetical protein
MKCKEIQELMPDLACGLSTATPELDEHIRTCADCGAKLAGLRQTMALLDEWKTPEPSPYFDTRLQARLREEKERQPSGWLAWMRKPALAITFVAVLAVSVTLVRNGGGRKGNRAATNNVTMATSDGPGTAVGDLEALDDNHDLYSDFDVLDDLQVQQDVTANP